MYYSYYVVGISATILIILTMSLSFTRAREHVRGLFLLYILTVIVLTLCFRKINMDIGPELNPIRHYSFLAKRLRKIDKEQGIYEGVKELFRNRRTICEILLNFFLFVPFGYFVPLIHKKFQQCWKTVLLGLLLSLFIEITQFFTHLGCFDTADLIHNAFGAGIGYLIYNLWLKDRVSASNNALRS